MSDLLGLAFDAGLAAALGLALLEARRQRRRQEAIAQALADAHTLIGDLARSVKALEEALVDIAARKDAAQETPPEDGRADPRREAVRLARAGHEPAAIARRLGMPREQAELIVRLVRSRG